MSATEPVLLIEHASDAVTTLTLNRPEKRNALSIELMERLRDEFRAVSRDPGRRRVIILKGAGAAFCAGLDLDEAAKPSHAERSANAAAELYEAIATTPLVTVAAARGAAVGGGAG